MDKKEKLNSVKKEVVFTDEKLGDNGKQQEIFTSAEKKLSKIENSSVSRATTYDLYCRQVND